MTLTKFNKRETMLLISMRKKSVIVMLDYCISLLYVYKIMHPCAYKNRDVKVTKKTKQTKGKKKLDKKDRTIEC